MGGCRFCVVRVLCVFAVVFVLVFLLFGVECVWVFLKGVFVGIWKEGLF